MLDDLFRESCGDKTFSNVSETHMPVHRNQLVSIFMGPYLKLSGELIENVVYLAQNTYGYSAGRRRLAVLEL